MSAAIFSIDHYAIILRCLSRRAAFAMGHYREVIEYHCSMRAFTCVDYFPLLLADAQATRQQMLACFISI